MKDTNNHEAANKLFVKIRVLVAKINLKCLFIFISTEKFLH